MDSQCYADSRILKTWIWILMKCTYQPQFIPINTGSGNITIEIKRGEMIFGRLTAAKELKIPGSSVLRYLKKLEEWGNITLKVNKHYTIVTVCKYDEYQVTDDASGQAVDKPWTSREQAVDNPWTGRGQSVDTYKKDKKEKNAENVKKEKKVATAATTFDHTLNRFWENENFRRAWADFSNMRQRTREPLNPLAIKRNFEMMEKTSTDQTASMREKYTEDVDYAADMLDQSTMKNWTGAFPVKNWYWDLKYKQNGQTGKNFSTSFN